ncbi:hypothetical protein [Nocardia niwae]|uniref:Uncharacterized protein n=1 Tax=Nocardia niwae TaxID=626084 RepID=A0ABV2XCS4_9NOCA
MRNSVLSDGSRDRRLGDVPQGLMRRRVVNRRRSGTAARAAETASIVDQVAGKQSSPANSRNCLDPSISMVMPGPHPRMDTETIDDDAVEGLRFVRI